ncbi:MAG TPA: cbb3-type cytochrome c oxidase subunit I [Candidatus Baltobacteraceae bacterium]|nr:cbb3-type cytochrome c oxidase subunit I [Candidatus Baltobacteraceae bacterium]
MNETSQNNLSVGAIDASCRVPLLALFGGAALWLVVGLVLALIASLTFHKPDMFADCPLLAYGHVQPAANDAILYGFCIPAALGVMLWIFARLSQTELMLPLVPSVAANIWHLGVFIGIIAVLIGDSTGFEWLEFPRGSSVLLFAAFLLIAISAVATFGARRERELYPSHWFLLAALLWFPWIYSTANLFLVAWPVRGVAQAVIGWWFANNLVFVWLALAGIGVAFYFLPKLAGRPLQSSYFALFVFWTLILFGTWCGIPQGAPVPAWLPTISSVASALTIIPLIAIAMIFVKTVCGACGNCKSGPFCYIKLGTAAFLLSALMLIAAACPRISHVTEFTWFGPAQTQLQIFGFFAIVICGAIYELLPRVMGFELPFQKFVRVQRWFFILGIILLAGSLAVGGIIQGRAALDPKNSSGDILQSSLPFLRISTTGLLLLLIGGLLFALNIFAVTFKWKLALLKPALAAIKAPLETSEVKS